MASINRSGTKRVPVGGQRPKKAYADVQQGIKELYPGEDGDVIPDIDIVFVPGLGAHPEESWQSPKTKFNWASSKDGLVRDFPRARILLFMYESAWTGPLKVKNFISNIGTTLLHGLQSKRADCPRRPIVFIGHSMGGLVIAKAVVLADSRRDSFPLMFETIAGCLFFGTPFGGAPVAAIAAMFAHVGEKIDQASSSKLLDLMKPGDEGLNELRNDFVRLAGKMTPRIELFCFWEIQPTDFAKMAGFPALSGLFKLAVPKNLAEFVSRDSATLLGQDSLGLEANHRDLVKFESFKDPRYQLVRDPLKRLIHGAGLLVKGRMQSTRNIDRSMVNSVMEALDGAQAAKKRKAISQTLSTTSWIPKEQEYVAWLSPPATEEEPNPLRCRDCLWIRGPEGRGKTNGLVGALEDIETMIRHDEEVNSGQAPTLFAYFFCDETPDYCTAEDVLKSLVRQLISQQESLAAYAKHFAKIKGKESTFKSQSQLTVENLWQALQDMLSDEFIGSRVYFAISNLHALPEDSESTSKFLNLLSSEIQNTDEDDKPPLIRWLVTSRKAHAIEEALTGPSVRLIDLEDDKYENQVQLMLRKQAHRKVAALSSEKKYNKALSYFASSLIGRRAQNSQWIEITCVKLQQLEPTENELRVRRLLESIPLDLKTLLDSAWMQVFRDNDRDVEKINEILRALILTCEDPSEDELAVLAALGGSDDDKAEIRRLVESCRPLLVVKRTGKNESKVSFLSVFVKTHLLEHSKRLLGLDEEETKWQHGVMALRSLSHVMDQLSFPEKIQPPESKAAASEDGGDDEHPDETEEIAEDGEGKEPEEDPDSENSENENEETDGESDEDVDDESEWDSDSYVTDDSSEADDDPEVEEVRDKALAYMVKNWLHHASKATLEIAEDLSLEKDFWMPDSIIRRRWLIEYQHLTSALDNFDRKTLTALHVAAAVGFQHLVAALIRNGHSEELNVRDSLVNTPLHFASYFGQQDIVEELLTQGASVDDGIEIDEQTPLHMASLAGNVQVMWKLIRRGANPNAVAGDIGPVLNAAIYSGNQAAVRLLVEQGVSLSFDHDQTGSPLQLAALLSDLTMFEYLIEKYADKLPPQEYDKALISSATAGRIEVFRKLLPYQHTTESFQKSLEGAAEEGNWDIVVTILQDCHGLQCDEVFYQASTGLEPQDKVLEAIWKHTGGAITQKTLDRSLYSATDNEKLSTVELCLKFGASPNATGQEYGNALTAAAYDGTLEIVKKLLDAGGDVNAPEGWPLLNAAAEGHYEVAEELLTRGARIDAIIEHQPQGTALQAAVEAGKSKIVSLLLEHGADPNLGSGPETSPVIAAARKGEAEIFELLIKAKARVDVFGGPDMSTPLTNAAAYLPLSSMQLLLDAGADINLPDHDDDTALIVASRRGDWESVKFLLENGADLMFTRPDGENALKAALQNANQECMQLLVDRVSVILTALKTAADRGNTAVSSILRSVATSEYLNYGEDDAGGDTQLDYDDASNDEHHDMPPTTVHAVAESSEDPLPITDTKTLTVVSLTEVRQGEAVDVSLDEGLENPLSFFNTCSQPFEPFRPSQPPKPAELEAPHIYDSPEQPAQQQYAQGSQVSDIKASNPGLVRRQQATRPLSRYNGKFSPTLSPSPSETITSQYQPPVAQQQSTPPHTGFQQRAESYPSPVSVVPNQEPYVLAQQLQGQQQLPPQPQYQTQQQHEAESFSQQHDQQTSDNFNRYQSPGPYNYNNSSFPPHQAGGQQPYRTPQVYPQSQPVYPDQPKQLQQPQPQTYTQQVSALPATQFQYNPANTHQPYQPQPSQGYTGTYPQEYGAPQQGYYGQSRRTSQRVAYDGEGWGNP